jgi:hypothetical protein
MCYDRTQLDERLTVEIRMAILTGSCDLRENQHTLRYSKYCFTILAQWHISIGGRPGCTIIPGTG